MNEYISRPGHLVVLVSVGILTLAVTYYGYKGTSIDSTDPIVYNFRILMEKNSLHIIDPKLFPFKCSICKTYVGTKTKHCGACNKCVSEFDHHCDWLNNCIG